MKRDMELVREILKKAEEANEFLNAKNLETEKYSHDTVGYHIRIMDEGGLISASFKSADRDPYYFVCINRLTWEGHGYLDAVRSDTVWAKTKSKLGNSIETVSLSVIKAVAEGVAKAQLGM